MSAANDNLQARRAWLRRSRECTSGRQIVGDVPPDLANSVDENGSLVTVDARRTALCRASASMSSQPDRRDRQHCPVR